MNVLLIPLLSPPCLPTSPSSPPTFYVSAKDDFECGAVGAVFGVWSEKLSCSAGLVGGVGWWGCLGTSGALEPVDSVQLRDVSGAIRCDAQVQMRSTFGSIAPNSYQKLRPDLDFPRVQGPYEQIPKSIACGNVRPGSRAIEYQTSTT